jgi:hypothetical protein
VGILISVGGFWAAIVQIRQARSAARDASSKAEVAAQTAEATARALAQNQLLLIIPGMVTLGQRMDRAANTAAPIPDIADLINEWNALAARAHGLLDPTPTNDKIRAAIDRSIEKCSRAKEDMRQGTNVAVDTLAARVSVDKVLQLVSAYSGRALRHIEREGTN